MGWPRPVPPPPDTCRCPRCRPDLYRRCEGCGRPYLADDFHAPHPFHSASCEHWHLWGGAPSLPDLAALSPWCRCLGRYLRDDDVIGCAECREKVEAHARAC